MKQRFMEGEFRCPLFSFQELKKIEKDKGGEDEDATSSTPLHLVGILSISFNDALFKCAFLIYPYMF